MAGDRGSVYHGSRESRDMSYVRACVWVSQSQVSVVGFRVSVRVRVAEW